MRDDLTIVLSAIKDSWSADTAYSANEWKSDNPARGHCVVSALVLQDYFGGELNKYKTNVNGVMESHYTNVLPDGSEVDTTRQQYADNQKLITAKIRLDGYSNIREKLFSKANTEQRYELLKSKVARKLKHSK